MAGNVKGRARWALIGDSLTSGWGAGGPGGGTGTAPGGIGINLRAKSMPSELAKKLNAAGTPSRADAVLGNSNTPNNNVAEFVAYNPNCALGAGWDIYRSADGAVPGGQCFICNGAGAFVFTPEVAADRFDIYANRYNGGGVLTVSDASGTLATVDTNTAPTPRGEMFRFVVHRSTASLSPISIQRTGGAIFLNGIVPYDTTSPRLELWNMGYAGSKVSDWLKNNFMWSPLSALSIYAPDFYTIALGGNDVANGVSSATFSANLQALITAAKGAAPRVALVKIHPGNPTTVPANLPPSYLAAMDALQTSNNLAPTINFHDNVPLTIADYYDGIHLTNSGYIKEAQEALGAA